MRNGVVQKKWYGLCENAWFPGQPIADLRICIFINIYENIKNVIQECGYTYKINNISAAVNHIYTKLS